MPRILSAHGGLACVLAGVLLAPAAVADDAARISRLETEIQQLRSQLAQAASHAIAPHARATFQFKRPPE